MLLTMYKIPDRSKGRIDIKFESTECCDYVTVIQLCLLPLVNLEKCREEDPCLPVVWIWMSTSVPLQTNQTPEW